MKRILPSGLFEDIPDDEDLVRFLTQSNHFNSTMVKPAAFLPNPKEDFTTSVFRHSGNPREELWKIGQSNITDRTVHGAAVFEASRVRGASLEVVAKEPPLRHANIVDWILDDDPKEQKLSQKEQADSIAQYAELIMREPI